MKKFILPYIWIVLVCAVVIPLRADSQDNRTEPKDKITVELQQSMIIHQSNSQIKITPGESLVQKQAREKQEQLNAQSATRTVIARERVSEPVVVATSWSLAELRTLYQSAASKFGIDWKLIEAVHQVESGKSTDTCKKSYAGATGPMQFLPSTFRHYANEGSDICSVHDSVYAAANLLARSGADTGDIDSALFSYNHSMSYVALVKSVMNSI